MRTKSLKKNKINVITLGCSKNVYDSEVLMGQLKASGKEVVHEQEGNIVKFQHLIALVMLTSPIKSLPEIVNHDSLRVLK